MGPRIREDRGEEGRTKWRLLRVRIGVAGGNEDGFPPPPSRGQAIREDKGGIREQRGNGRFANRIYGGVENSTLVGPKRVRRAWFWRDHMRAFSCFS